MRVSNKCSLGITTDYAIPILRAILDKQIKDVCLPPVWVGSIIEDIWNN